MTIFAPHATTSIVSIAFVFGLKICIKIQEVNGRSKKTAGDKLACFRYYFCMV
jgi:hypothetical protein